MISDQTDSRRASSRDFEFALATREELWVRGRCMERIAGHGIAVHRGRRIEASDRAVPELVSRAGEELDTLREVAKTLADARVRAVATARRVGGVTVTEGAMTVTMRHVSIVTSAKWAPGDAAALREFVGTEARMEARDLPIVWKNGSAAVLLHEAAGHAAEHSAPRVEWPEWLRVADEPSFTVDDCGRSVRATNLLRDQPASMRRETFRDVPLRRMSSLVVRQHNAPFTIPDERIEIYLVAGGQYDPLTDSVAVHVEIADEVSGRRTRRLRPFTIRKSRREVARSLAGAAGDPIRYPGVICSREGQEIIVGSHAPLVVTT